MSLHYFYSTFCNILRNRPLAILISQLDVHVKTFAYSRLFIARARPTAPALGATAKKDGWHIGCNLAVCKLTRMLKLFGFCPSI